MGRGTARERHGVPPDETLTCTVNRCKVTGRRHYTSRGNTITYEVRSPDGLHEVTGLASYDAALKWARDMGGKRKTRTCSHA